MWGEGGLQGKPPLMFLLMEYRCVLYNVFRPSCWACCQWEWGGGRGSCKVSSYGTLLRCCMRSAGQVRWSLLSDGPLLYKCSIRSLAWLYVLVLYLVTSRWISFVILDMCPLFMCIYFNLRQYAVLNYRQLTSRIFIQHAKNRTEWKPIIIVVIVGCCPPSWADGGPECISTHVSNIGLKNSTDLNPCDGTWPCITRNRLKTRQFTYVYRNTVARSRNHCRSGNVTARSLHVFALHVAVKNVKHNNGLPFALSSSYEIFRTAVNNITVIQTTN